MMLSSFASMRKEWLRLVGDARIVNCFTHCWLACGGFFHRSCYPHLTSEVAAMQRRG